MKSVLISIQPKWVGKICNNITKYQAKPIYEKCLEIRKSAPKKVPFKCFIYATKGLPQIIMKYDTPYSYIGNGKVIGEFICDRISEFYYNHNINEYNIGGYSLNISCLSINELENYGKGKTLYSWHIHDLKIYDKPKEISEFKNLQGVQIKRPFQSWGYIEDLGEQNV